MIELILGGARSGKSRLAEGRADTLSTNADSNQNTKQVIYVATAQNQDSEMDQRINQHQTRRPKHWITHEERIALASVLAEHNAPENIVLIDCLTLWVSNVLCQEDDILFQNEKNALLHQLSHQKCNVIMVSNETGLGVVPMGQLTRRFVDESGWLHQEIATLSDRVTLVIAGLTHTLKAPVTTQIPQTTTQTTNQIKA